MASTHRVLYVDDDANLLAGLERTLFDVCDVSTALGVDVRNLYAVVFTLGTMLGTVGGALAKTSSRPNGAGDHPSLK